MPMFINSAYTEELNFINATTGAAIDVSAYDFGVRFFQPAPSHKTPTTIIAGSGIDVTNAATGIIVISLTPAQVKCFGIGTVRVEVFKNYSNDTTRTLIAEGSETVEGGRFDA